MSHQNKILIYMIENLGLPLMSALGALQKKASTSERDAEIMAKMLTSSVDLGMAISAKMNIPTDAEKAEALRFQLTALAARALADRIKIKGKEPSDIDIDSLKATTDSLFVFSENFALNEEGISYLDKIGLKDVEGRHINDLSVIDALLPVIAAIEHKDRGLFPNIADRLIKESDSLTKEFMGDRPTEITVIVRHKVLKLLTTTFATIYPDVIGNNGPIGEVWQEFDRQKALIVLLMDYLMTGQKNETANEGAGAHAPIPEKQVNEVQTPENKVSSSSPVSASLPSSQSSGGATPLSFFKKD